MSQIQVAAIQFEIHQTPLEKVSYEGANLLVEFDEVQGRRVRLIFSPWQALKVTTVDCFDVQTLLIDGYLNRRLLELTESQWIAALKEELHQHDHQATFLNQAHHFVLPFQENIVEVVAWGFEYHIL
ncbi:hypothetical protein [Chloroflexus sp.]|jgi:hypothetical protein|uniref:hypothetical protein n=1 Tax=Chloroflexus sp. TaxID=1904827 RepID=UPI00257C36B5|nr:hypothetical protein [Chloroflexus sp.]